MLLMASPYSLLALLIERCTGPVLELKTTDNGHVRAAQSNQFLAFLMDI